MGESGISRYQTYIIIGILAAFSIFVLWIRLLPMFLMNGVDILNVVGSDDPLYNLRQIESMVQNFPAYGWFDPMTLFPTGNTIHWGPLFIWLISAVCIVAGATTRPEIIQLSLAVPPVLAAFMVPVVFLLVRRISEWKTGLIAAGFIAVVAGQYFFRSLFGYLDHHIAEVLFSTIFSLGYIWTLGYMKDHPVDIGKFQTFRVPLLLSGLTGISFVVGLYTMPTMILFALVAGIFTIIQFIWDFARKRPSDYLLLLNTVVFGIATLGFLLLGAKTEGLQLNFYTLGHVLAYLILILGTAVLFWLARILAGKNPVQYVLSIIGIAVVAIAVLFFAAPSIYNTLIGGIIEFFGQSPYYLTIQEARSWTLPEVWDTYSWGIILAFGGFIVMIYESIRDERPDQHYVLIWSVIILFSTWQHIRYEYFLSTNIAILSGICVGYLINWSYPEAGRAFKRMKEEEPEVKQPKKGSGGKQRKTTASRQKGTSPRTASWKVPVLALTVVLAILFVYSQVDYEYRVASGSVINMNQDWRESLEWMGANTPDTGVDYYKVYDKAGFVYPDTAYGVMSWWDYGHMITYIAKRIPNANPFQAGVAGPYGSAAYFMSLTEEDANVIADHQGTRYVITDIEMDTQKFWAMATWFNATVGPTPYQRIFLIPDQATPGAYSSATLYQAPYYETMVSRLHNFDGSMAEPSQAAYVEYSLPTPDQPYPAIIRAQMMNASSAVAAAEQYNLRPDAGYEAGVVSSGLLEAITPVSALQHYRLVHESPRNVFASQTQSQTPDVKYVKVFEYVKGAVIRGEGTIEVQLISNTGRQFTYRQQSENGTFVVPYSTTGNPYGVRASGKYRVSGTGREIDVPEDAVLQGTLIS
ncbi:MAG: oligosaccharyl transferase, archaeosortase A system-associated [Methanoregulaceae archaeon]|nr:oligosaccharyl transferase, archaeosortase A system-associated [Methanoregulaceae archaeon]